MANSISRREFLRASAALGLVTASGGLLAACASSGSSTAGAASSGAASAAGASPLPAGSAASAGGQLTYQCATGAFAQAEINAWINPFSKETGIVVTPDQRDPTTDLLKTAVDTKNYTFDMTLAFSGIPKADWPKYFEKLDFSIIPQSEIDPHWITDYWCVTDIAAEVFAYNLDATKGVEPTSLADFFDLTKFPGKRSMEDNYATAYAWALMADGVPPDKLVPYDVPRAQKKLATIKDKIVWFQTGTQTQELMASGETPLGITWNGRAQKAANGGAKVKVLWNPQILTYDRTVILKGTPNRDAAMKFFGYVTSKEHSGELTKYVPYVPANKDATIDPATKDWAPKLDQPAFIPDYDYWDSTYDQLNPGFQAFKTS